MAKTEDTSRAMGTDGLRDLSTDGPQNPPLQASSDARRGASRMQSFRTSSLPLLSPVEMYNRHSKAHDSLRPPLLRPESVVRPKRHREGPTAEEIANGKLALFRRLVGIDTDESYMVDGVLNRPVENIGIYTHVVREEVRSKSSYKRYSILINSSLGMQIVFAAALTALGAADGSRSAITVFGAINTVLAAVLTFLKGSGLPNREKYYCNNWAKLREYIEQRERDFGRPDCPLDVDEQLTLIEKMYYEVRQDIEANTPDSYTSVTQAKKLIDGLAHNDSQHKEKDLEKGRPAIENPFNSAATSTANGHPVTNTGLGASIGSGVGLGSGPSGIAPPPIIHPPGFQHPPDSMLEKLASRLSGTTAGAGAGGIGGLLGSLAGNEKANHVLDSVTRLSHKMGADGLAERLSHIERSHDELNRGVDSATGAMSTEAERLAAAGRSAGNMGDRIARETAAHVGDEFGRDTERLRDAGRSVEAQGTALARDAGAQAERMRSGALGSMRSLSHEGEGYLHRMTGALDREASKLRAAGSRAQDLGSGIMGRLHGGVERAESSARGGIERVGSGVQGAERGLEREMSEVGGAFERAGEDVRHVGEGEREGGQPGHG